MTPILEGFVTLASRVLLCGLLLGKVTLADVALHPIVQRGSLIETGTEEGDQPIGHHLSHVLDIIIFVLCWIFGWIPVQDVDDVAATAVGPLATSISKLGRGAPLRLPFVTDGLSGGIAVLAPAHALRGRSLQPAVQICWAHVHQLVELPSVGSDRGGYW